MLVREVKLTKVWPSDRARIQRLASEQHALAVRVYKQLARSEWSLPQRQYFALQSAPYRWTVVLYLPPQPTPFGEQPAMAYARGPTLRSAVGRLDQAMRRLQ